jgi:hypothetical protein
MCLLCAADLHGDVIVDAELGASSLHGCCETTCGGSLVRFQLSFGLARDKNDGPSGPELAVQMV